MESIGTKGMAHSGLAEAKPSEQGTRKSNGTNAAPSCQAETYVAMQHVSGYATHSSCQMAKTTPQVGH